MANWTLFSNHGHVLLFLSRKPDARLRDVAREVGITERAVQKIVRDLQDGGLLGVTKYGRRNRYRINTRKNLRHPLEAHRTVGHLVSFVQEGAEHGRKARGGSKTSRREKAPAAAKKTANGPTRKVEAIPEQPGKRKRSRRKPSTDDQQGSLF